MKYDNTIEAIAKALQFGDIQTRFGGCLDDQDCSITLYDKDSGKEAAEIVWNVNERSFSFSENDDPRYRRTGSLYRVLDALRRDLYLDDLFDVSVFNVYDRDWNEYDGVKAVVEVRDGKPSLVNIRHKGTHFIEEYDEERGSNFIKEVVKTDEEISEKEFFEIVDKIINQPSWYRDRIHVENRKALEAYRSGSFNLSDFYDPLDGPRDPLDGTSYYHGGHWTTIQAIKTECFSFTDKRISDHTPWYRECSDADRMKYLRSEPSYHIDAYPGDIWLVKYDIFGVRRRLIDKTAKD